MSTLLIYSTLNGFESNFSQILKKYKKKKKQINWQCILLLFYLDGTAHEWLSLKSFQHDCE